MIYECYLDDSKDKRQEHVYVCAGFVAPRHVWVLFCKEWSEALRAEGLRYWKTSEYKGLYGEFTRYRGYSEDLLYPALVAIKDRLMGVVMRHKSIRGIGVSIPVKVYEDIMAHPSAPIVLGNSLYDHAFEGVLVKTAESVSSGYVAFAHDEGQDFDHLRAVYNRFCATNKRSSERMSGFAPLDDKKHPPLQIADMLANSVMGRHRDMLGGAEVSPLEVDFIQKSDFYTWDRQYGVALLRSSLMAEGITVPDDLIAETAVWWEEHKIGV